MGFFGVLGNILSGKPPISHEPAAKPGLGPSTMATPVGAGAKMSPVAQVVQVESHLSGNRFEVRVHVRNSSPVLLFIDKLALFGSNREIDINLAPGAEREVTVYSGQPLRGEEYRTAELQYRTQDGDYFMARHDMRYRRDRDGQVQVSAMQLVTPIKDVH